MNRLFASLAGLALLASPMIASAESTPEGSAPAAEVAPAPKAEAPVKATKSTKTPKGTKGGKGTKHVKKTPKTTKTEGRTIHHTRPHRTVKPVKHVKK